MRAAIRAAEGGVGCPTVHWLPVLGSGGRTGVPNLPGLDVPHSDQPNERWASMATPLSAHHSSRRAPQMSTRRRSAGRVPRARRATRARWRSRRRTASSWPSRPARCSPSSAPPASASTRACATTRTSPTPQTAPTQARRRRVYHCLAARLTACRPWTSGATSIFSAAPALWASSR